MEAALGKQTMIWSPAAMNHAKPTVYAGNAPFQMTIFWLLDHLNRAEKADENEGALRTQKSIAKFSLLAGTPATNAMYIPPSQPSVSSGMGAIIAITIQDPRHVRGRGRTRIDGGRRNPKHRTP